MLTAVVLSALALLTPAGIWDTAQQIRAETHLTHVGTGAPCSTYALDYHARLRAAGLPARIVVVQATMTNLYDSHSFVEVKTNGRWVISDPTFNGVWQLNGRLLGTLEIQRALRNGTWRKIRWAGPQKAIRDYYVDPRLLFRHAHFREQQRDGAWVQTRSTTVPRLHTLYYAQRTRPADAVAGLIVSGHAATYGGHTLAQLPDSRWISPILMLHGVPSVPAGAYVMWVRRYH